MNSLRSRVDLANIYRGGIVMTTVILIFGYTTPRLLRWFAKRLACLAE